MTFKSARQRFILAFGFITLLHLSLGTTLWWLILPSSVYFAVIVYGSSMIQASFFAPAYCYASGVEKEIALSFDDGPHPHYTPQVLSTLAQFNASATFFVVGKNIQGNESILKQIDADGHSIGNHSYSHSLLLDFKSKNGFMKELEQTAEHVFNVIGKRMKLFRPPYGVTTPSLVRASKELDYSIIGWNIRSLDTTKDSVSIISQRVQAQIKPGAIILFHDSSEKTLCVLRHTLDFAKQNGYKIVGVESLLKIKAYE